MHTDSWFKCYGQAWGNLCCPAAVAHPAKFSRKLIFRIFEHAIEEGWVKPGEICLDPFGGVALGGLPAMLNGLHWVGIELEARFCALAQDNIDLWNKRYAAQMPNWGSAVIVQGDSRRLGEVLERAQLCLSSPPYADSIHGSGADAARKRIAEGRYKGLRPDVWTSPGNIAGSTYGDGYSADPANLGNLPDTGFELALSSPPYAGSLGDGKSGIDWGKQADRDTAHPHGWDGEGYGSESGQLGAMPDTGFEAALAVSSPTFPDGGMGDKRFGSGLKDKSIVEASKIGGGGLTYYGDSSGQLAQMPTGSHAEALGSTCRFCNGAGFETIDSVDVDGNHSTHEIKCRHCAEVLDLPAQAGGGL